MTRQPMMKTRIGMLVLILTASVSLFAQNDMALTKKQQALVTIAANEEVTIDLGESRTVSTVAVRLNPSAIWEPRTQEIAVSLSMDGTSYSEAAAAAKYDFDPATGNRIRIDFPSAEVRYVKLVFTLNTSSRTGGAQAAEIEVYE